MPDPHPRIDPRHGRDLDIPAIVVVGIVSTLLTVIVVLGAWTWFEHLEARAFERYVEAPAYNELVTQEISQRERLIGYGWVDQERGIVRIPIDRAVELHVERHRASRPADP